MSAISRYGARVIDGTFGLIKSIQAKGQLVEGPHIAAFERAVEQRLDVPRAVATSYGRMALYHLLRAMNLPAGGEVIVPALTFWVVPELVRVAGFTPVFADVDPQSFNMTPASFERMITDKTVAVVPTHLWGLPCDMDEIVTIAHSRNIKVIEDCAHAFGATYKGRPAGTLGDAAFFSLQTFKPLNSYGGGVAVAQDRALMDRVAASVALEPRCTESEVKKKLFQGLATWTMIRPGVFTWSLYPVLRAAAIVGWNPDVYFWEKIRPLNPTPVPYRQRFTNVQAAIALEGLTNYLDTWTKDTRTHAKVIIDAVAGTPGIKAPSCPPDREHAFYQFCVYVANRDKFVLRCLKHGIDLETLHVDVCPSLELFAGCRGESAGAAATTQVIQAPIYASLSMEEVERIGRVLHDVAMMDVPQLAGPSTSAYDRSRVS